LPAGLKTVITGEGVWRIRKREKVPVIEVFQVEEKGYGDILSPAFVEWRTKGLKDQQDRHQNAPQPSNGEHQPPEPP
jgi:hypothetical protein